jgi:S1-C subfamily serine protease
MMKRSTLMICLLATLSTWAAGAEQRPGWLGMGFTYEAGTEGKDGWLHVRHVLAGSPADAAGIKPQDLIVAVNGKPPRFKSSVEAMRSLSSLRPGDRVTFVVTRAGTRRTVKVTAAPMPDFYYERWKQNEAIGAKEKESQRRH